MQATVNNTSRYQSGRSAYWPLHSNQASKTSQRSLRVQLQNSVQTLIHQLSGSSTPQVWSTQGADGQTVWNAQDIASERIIRNASETELRVWLEERYTF